MISKVSFGSEYKIYTQGSKEFKKTFIDSKFGDFCTLNGAELKSENIYTTKANRHGISEEYTETTIKAPDSADSNLEIFMNAFRIMFKKVDKEEK